MKKVLFATTALVATAGVAAADVTFGGYGRFGLAYVDAENGDSDTDVTSRFRLQIDATSESDSGVVFGARVRIQQNNTDNNSGSITVTRDPAGNITNVDDIRVGPSGTGINGVRFFARAGGFEVGVGNIFGALEFMPGQYPIDLGLTGLRYDYTAYNFRSDAYSSGGSGAAGQNGVEVLYSFGDFSLHVSASDVNSRIAGHIAYNFSDWTVALGAQDSNSDADTDWTATVGGDIGFMNVTLAYADNGTGGDRVVLAGRFDVGAATNVELYVADNSGSTDGSSNDTGYGIDFNHNMGGGTSIRGGVAERINGDLVADLGVRFDF